MKKHLDYKIIGETQDDAVGESFDKVARILGLGYPGGPAVAACAAQYQNQNTKYQISSEIQKPHSKYHNNLISDAYDLKLPRPMINSNDFNFSFSGLKTAVLYKVKKVKKELSVTDYKLLLPVICHEFQQAAVDVLVAKTLRAAKENRVKTILLAGGVSANEELRSTMRAKIKKELPSLYYSLPLLNYCTDNATMIAAAAFMRWQQMSERDRKRSHRNWQHLNADANLVMR